MGGKSKSKQEQKTSTTTNTQTTVGDIGLTGANAVDLAAVLESGSIQHDQIIGENLANLYQAAGSGYQQLIGGASDLIHTSQEATLKQQLIGLEQQTRNAEISLEQQTRNAEISLEQQTRNAESLRASMRSNQASQARNLQWLGNMFQTGQKANIKQQAANVKQQAANTEQQKMGFSKLGDLMRINREIGQRQSEMGIKAIEAGVKAVHPELTNEFNLNKALPYITAGIALMSLMAKKG